MQTQVKFLGKIVDASGISINPDSIVAVKKWPVPTNKKEVESFIGYVNYHRDHIKNFAELAEPLHQLTGHKSEFHWSEEQQQAFVRLKDALIDAVILGYPSPEGTFILDTDASQKTIGAELSQVQDGVEKVISFASKVLTTAQRNYCTTRKELLAIVCFTRQFRHYLLGRRFIVRTDHNSLKWLLNFKNIEGQLARWIEELSQYNMVIQHRPGKQHGNADGLSRIPDELEPCHAYHSEIKLEDLPCGGCKFCTRAREQWSTFEQDVDFVVPLTIRRIEKGSLTTDSNWISNSSIDNLNEEQMKDKDLNILKQWIIEDYDPNKNELQLQSKAIRHFWNLKSQLVVQGEILYYRWEDPVCPRLLVMVPEQMKEKLIRECHDVRTAGHFGQYKTLERLKQVGIWYGMSQDCKLYISSCPICNKNKKSTKKARANLEQYHAGFPMERVHMDILGPLPVTPSGNKYILMVIDQFTKWVECYPIPNQSSEIVAKSIVDNFFSRFGCPVQLHTDQGKNMDGNLVRQLCELLQIDKTRTTPYHPSSNGQIERYNRTLLQTIRCFLKNKQNNWDKFLQQLAGAIRSAKNPQTGFSPNLLMLGREVFQPVDIMFGNVALNTERFDHSDYLKELAQTLHQVHSLARETLKTSQDIQKKTYDLKSNQNQYAIGDVVYKLDQATKKGQSTKLKSPWKGPYLISDVKPPVLYKIKDRKGESWIHHDRLKLCRDRDLPVWLKRIRNDLLNASPQGNADDADEFEDLSGLFNTNAAVGSATDRLLSPSVGKGMHADVPEPLLSHDSVCNSSSASDLLMPQKDPVQDIGDPHSSVVQPDESGHDIVGTSDRLAFNDFELTSRKIIEDIKGLEDAHSCDDLNDTFIYQMEDDAGSRNTNDSRKTRTKKRPAYLQDFVE